MVDLVVTDASGLPEQAYLSMRVGDTRKQALCNIGEHWYFPVGQQQTLLFDIFEKVGSTEVDLSSLPDSGADKLENICIQKKTGQTMRMSLKMRQHTSSKVHGQTVKTQRHQAAVKAKNYLEDDSVQMLLQAMVQKLLDNQPEDPVEFVCGYLLEQTGRQKVSKEPTVLSVQKGKHQKPVQEAWRQEQQKGEEQENTAGFSANTCSGDLPDLSSHHSVTTDILKEDPSIWTKLKSKKTPGGVTFARCIKPGIDNKGHSMIKAVGAIVGDKQCFETFREFFDPLLRKVHAGIDFSKPQPHCVSLDKISEQVIDPDGKYAVSTRVWFARSLEGFPLTPAINFEERRQVERVLARIFLEMKDGEYYPLVGSQSYMPKLGGMSEQQRKEFLRNQLVFEAPDSSVLLSAGVGQDWPDSRGVFLNDDRDAMIWVNNEDHLHMQTTGSGNDIKGTFSRLCRLESTIRKALEEQGHSFMQDATYGYINSSLSRLGVAMHASAVLWLPLLSVTKDFKKILKDLGVIAQGGRKISQGTLQGSAAGYWEITHIARMGTSEVSLLNTLIAASAKLIEMERALAIGEKPSNEASSPNPIAIGPIGRLLEDKILTGLNKSQPTSPKAPVEKEKSDKTESKKPDSDFELSILRNPKGSIDHRASTEFPIDDIPVALPDLSNHNSICAEVLKQNPALWKMLSGKRTKWGISAALCIKPGMDHVGHPFIKTMGLVAGDEECYSLFRDLFEAAIQLKHNGHGPNSMHPTNLDYREVCNTEADATGLHVKGTRITASRNISGFLLPPASDQASRHEIERVLVKILFNLPNDMKGTYYPLAGSFSFPPRPGGMSPDDEGELRKLGVLFQQPDTPLMTSSGFDREWPDARGVFVMDKNDFAIWINFEDHCQLISLGEGPIIKATFTRLCQIEERIHSGLRREGLDWMHNDRLGFLTSCPSNLGTGMSVTVDVRIPKLAASDDFREVCKALGVHARRKAGTTTDPTMEVSNLLRLGQSEVIIMDHVITCCQKLVEMELQLNQGLSICVPKTSMLTAAREEAVISNTFSELPGLGSDEYPGFSTEDCPETLPDLTNHHSLMAQILKANPSIWNELRNEQTASGVTFGKCIKSGMDVRGNPTTNAAGAVAGDQECYSLFANLFDPVIKLLHDNYSRSGHHSTDLNFLGVTNTHIDQSGMYASDAKIVCRRNITGFRMPSAISVEERRSVEILAVRAFIGLPEDLHGEYYPLTGSFSYLPRPGGMSEQDQRMLQQNGVLLKEPTSALMLSSGMGRQWPDARGVFLNKEKNFMIWVNDEDHLTMTASSKTSDFKALFRQFCVTESAIQKALQAEGFTFMKDDHLGFITACPSNLGSGLRLSVTLRLPLLSTQENFKEIYTSKGLKAKHVEEDYRSTAAGQHGSFEVTLSSFLGFSEVDLVDQFIAGCKSLIDMELLLERGERLPTGELPIMVDNPISIDGPRRQTKPPPSPNNRIPTSPK